MKRRNLLVLAMLGVLSGCGGGLGINPNGQVTRDTEPSLSKDALILAAGLSETPWVELGTARQIDSDLKEIRTISPALTAIGARGDADPKSVVISMKADAPWRASWKAGTLTTGVAALDAALTDYRATSVKEIANLGTSVVCTLTFDQWMNVQKLSESLKPLATPIVASEVNGYIGDGDDIEVLETGRIYRFKKGWGDCPAGCTSKHLWTATKSGAGWTVVESGTPLDSGE
jgi:hypothetical protein